MIIVGAGCYCIIGNIINIFVILIFDYDLIYEVVYVW